MLRGIDQGVRALADRQLHRALREVVVNGRPRLVQKARQGFPMVQQVDDRFAQTPIGFHQPRRRLLLQPALELFPDWPPLALVLRYPLLGRPLFRAGILIVVEHVLERVPHHGTLRGKGLVQLPELAPPLRQTVTATPRVFLGVVAR